VHTAVVSDTVLYVYAIGRDDAALGRAAEVALTAEAVDRSHNFGSVTAAGLAAVVTPVPRSEFSQEAVDSRAGDLEWLGAIGYRHQGVILELMTEGDVLPLRAFSLFSSEGTLRKYLEENAERLRKVLERVAGKREWTLRVEFDPEPWNEALSRRVSSLADLTREIGAAAAGKAFLLRKKLDEEKKRASRQAEQQVVSEIESSIVEKLACQTVAESREQRGGAFPQLNVLINRDEESVLQDLQTELSGRYNGDGISIALTGPWPPYTFAHV
jgi:Gas vesicle synthesis protein GvpL/GvpF